MAWLEMSRDVTHGGGDWGFTQCLWAPTYKRSGVNPNSRIPWPYWSLLLQVQPSDIVFHLRGEGKEAAFTGFSIAQTPGSVTSERPPFPDVWGYATTFYRVLLRDYERFPKPILLHDVFARYDRELREYLKANRSKRKLFYIEQDRWLRGALQPVNLLQCLNGAYFSEMDAELATIVLGVDVSKVEQSLMIVASDHLVTPDVPLQSKFLPDSLPTGERMQRLWTRVGQQQFSAAVRDNFAHRCCFPECPAIGDDLFLVGAHIARWSDVPELRGKVENGVCLCRMHDAAFESGLFTINSAYRVLVKKERVKDSPWSREYLAKHDGEMIARGKRMPSLEALQHHWRRTGFVDLLASASV